MTCIYHATKITMTLPQRGRTYNLGILFRKLRACMHARLNNHQYVYVGMKYRPILPSPYTIYYVYRTSSSVARRYIHYYTPSIFTVTVGERISLCRHETLHVI